MPTLTLITQVYPPDPAAVGQHLADVAEAMAVRGWKVRVYTASRGYDDPDIRYPYRESRNGVDVRRFALSSFGKGSIAIRLVAQASFMAQAVVAVLVSRRPALVLASTSPPFAGFGAAVVSVLRRVPFVWWVMDINPDQMVATGKLRASALAARLFDWMNRVTLVRAAKVITLDRFMADTLRRKAVPPAGIAVVPPWSPADELDATAHAVAEFKRRHGLEGRFIVMYSGNHALCHPLTTLLDAAAEMEADARFRFVFIGSGAGKAEIDERIAQGARNIVSLPYQPRASLGASLNAAHLHVVSMGDAMVGIVHPCKIYGIMAIGAPVLLAGAATSAAGEVVTQHRLGAVVPHGASNKLREAITEIAAWAPEERDDVRTRARSLASGTLGRQQAIAMICDTITAALNVASPGS